MASIFTMPADKIDAKVLGAFLDQANPEATVLEYKRELNDHVLKTIAAMANTLGGVLLIGVPAKKAAKGLPDVPLGVALEVSERLTSQCFAKLEPPFEPEIIPVRLDNSDRYVLIVRVNPGQGQSPVVMDGTVYIRLRGQTQAADRYRMAAMFAERGHIVGVVPTHGRPRGGGGHPLFDSQAEALIVRTTVQTRVPPQSGVLNGRVRAALRDAVRESELERWLTEQTSLVAERQQRPRWVRDGFITQSVEPLRRPPVRAVEGAATVAGQAVIELAVGRLAAGWATLILDLGVRPITADQKHEDEFPYTLELREVKALIGRLLQAALDEVAPAVLPLLTGTPLWLPAATNIALDTGTTPISRYVVFPKWRRGQNAADRSGPFFETPPGVDIREPGDRSEVVHEWLAQMLYNQGFSDFDDQLSQL
jgi:Putative DNA-binding domain